MGDVHRGLVFLFFFIVFCSGLLLNTDAADTGVPKVEALPGAENFIEDKVTNFSCSLENATARQSYKWSIRDRKSGLKTFFTNRMLDTLPSFSTGPSVFLALVMRRDFSNSHLECTPDGGRTGKLLLPEIKKTVPIDEVRLSPVDFRLGTKFSVFCDIKTSRSPKAVRFRNILEFFKPTYHAPLSASWIRYGFDFKKRVTLNPFNGLICQCVAMTNGIGSKTGNVMSKVVALKVHFFNYTSPKSDQKRVVVRGRPLTLNLTIDANPVPRVGQFAVSQCHLAMNSCEALLSPPTIRIKKIIGDYRHELTAQFVPQTSSSYRVEFRSPLVNKTSANFFIDVIYVQFLSILFGYKDESTLRLTLTVLANPRPRFDQFSVIRANQSTRRVVILNRVVTPREANRFDVELLVRSNKSAIYQVAFKSDLLNVSRPIKVMAYEAPNKGIGFGTIIVIVVILLIVLLGIVILGIFCYKRRRKGTPNRNGDHELPVLTPPGGGRVTPEEVDPLLNGSSPTEELATNQIDGAPSEGVPDVSFEGAASQEVKDAPSGGATPQEVPDVPSGGATSQEVSGVPSGDAPPREVPDVPSGVAPSQEVPNVSFGGAASQEAPDVPSGVAPPQEAPDVPSGVAPPPDISLPPVVLFKYYVPTKAASDGRMVVQSRDKTWSNVLIEGLGKRKDPVVFQKYYRTNATSTYIMSAKKVPKPPREQGYFNKDCEKITDMQKDAPNTLSITLFVSNDVNPHFVRKDDELTTTICVHDEVDFLCLTPDGQLNDCDPGTTLFQPQWMVLILGMRNGEEYFPQLRCDIATSFWSQSKRKPLGTEEGVVNTTGKEENWRRFYLLLRDGDPILSRLGLPKENYLEMHRRKGARVTVRNGCLAVIKPSTSDEWAQPRKPDDLDELLSHPQAERPDDVDMSHSQTI